jgi:hypothetical protein
MPDVDGTDSNVTIQLMKIVDYGLSDGVLDMMNTVTLTDVIYEIGQSNTTRPFLSATVLALIPVLILNRDETTAVTTTTTNGHSRSLSLVSSFTQRGHDEEVQTTADTVLSVDETCEMKYMECQIQNMLVAFDP